MPAPRARLGQGPHGQAPPSRNSATGSSFGHGIARRGARRYGRRIPVSCGGPPGLSRRYHRCRPRGRARPPRSSTGPRHGSAPRVRSSCRPARARSRRPPMSPASGPSPASGRSGGHGLAAVPPALARVTKLTFEAGLSGRTPVSPITSTGPPVGQRDKGPSSARHGSAAPPARRVRGRPRAPPRSGAAWAPRHRAAPRPSCCRRGLALLTDSTRPCACASSITCGAQIHAASPRRRRRESP